MLEPCHSWLALEGALSSDVDQWAQHLRFRLESVLGKGTVGNVTSIDFGRYIDSSLDGVDITVFSHLHDVSLENSQLTNDDLIVVGQLKQLRGLNLAHRMTDAGLMHLQALSSLQGLKLNASQVTDAGFAHLVQLSSLELVIVNASQITQTSVGYLGQLPRLRSITVVDSTVTDDDLSRLQAFPLIDTLWLRGAPVSDAGLIHVRAMPQRVSA